MIAHTNGKMPATEAADPRARECERGIPAITLMAPQLVGTVRQRLKPNDFFDDINRIIIRHQFAIDEAGYLADVTAVADSMARADDLETIGGLGTLTELFKLEPTPANLDYYITQVKRASRERRAKHSAERLFRADSREFDRIYSEEINELTATYEERAETVKGFEIITSADLDGATFDLRYLIEGFMVDGQPCLWAGPKKALKTTLALAAAFALVTATKFLGRFTVSEAVRVLIMSGESGLATLQETIRRISAAHGMTLAELANLFWSTDLPQVGNPEHLATLRRQLAELQIKVLFLDPVYLCGFPGESASNLMIVGELLKGIGDLCQEVGVTLVLCHHTKKGVADPYEAPELEHIAWAGFQEFARQWVLLARREKYEPGTGEHRLWLSVGGSAGHSSLWALDVAEGAYSPGVARTWEVEVSTAQDARQDVQERKAEEKAERRDEKVASNLEAIKRTLAKPALLAGETKNIIRQHTGLGSAAFDVAVARGLDLDELTRCDVQRTCRDKPYDGFKLVTEDSKT